MISIKRLSYESMCVSETDMPKLKTPHVTRYVAQHDQFGNLGHADVCQIEVEDLDYRVFLADVRTGTIYCPDTMRCQTAPMELR